VTDRQTDRHRQTDRQTLSTHSQFMYVSRCCDGLTDRQTDRQTETQTDRHRQTDRQTDRDTDRQTDRQTETQTDRQTDKLRLKHTLLGGGSKMSGAFGQFSSFKN